MKAICINNGFIENELGNRYDAPELKESETYTIVKIGYGGGYYLQEVEMIPECHGYNPKRFIPLSEIDELELVNEKELTN